MKRSRPKLGLRQIGAGFVLTFGLILASAASFRYLHKGSPALRWPALKWNGGEISTQKPTPLMNDKAAGADPTDSRIPKSGRYFYRDGDFVGTPFDVFYGLVQVSVSIRHGRIADVKWLRDPEDIGLSHDINHDAMPALTKEAIAVQNAHVDMISGASFTVLGFRASLDSALAKAARDRNAP